MIGKPSVTDSFKGQFAGVIRRGTAGHYYNHIFVNYRNGLEIRDGATKAQIGPTGAFSIENTIFFNFGSTTAPTAPFWPTGDAAVNEEKVMLAADVDSLHEGVSWNNKVADPGLPAEASSLKTPNFKPAAGSEALKVENAKAPPDDGFFDKSAQFVGAVGADDWTAGWTAYPQIGTFGQ